MAQDRKEYMKLYKKAYNEKNKEAIKEKKKEYQDKNKDSKKEYDKEYYLKNIDEIKEFQKKYRQNNKEIIKGYYKKYSKENKETIKENKNEYQKNRREKDPLFKLIKNIRSLISISINNKNYQKESRTQEILGCSFEDFKIHLESKFESWMSWENYGNPKDGIFEPNKTWDIDHIKPLASATNESELLELNHYTNLQPLCSYHNRWIKSDN